jgi:gluconolactonase
MNVTPLPGRFAFPEGPCVGPDGRLYVCEVEGGWVTRMDPAGPSRWVETGGRPVGGAFHPSGDLYLCNSGLRAVLRIGRDGNWTFAAQASAGKPLVRPNDLVFDRAGRLYFTDPVLDPARSRTEPSGMVHRLAPDGTVEPVGSGVAFSNGIAFGPDGALYVAETARGRILRWELRPDGLVASRAVFATVTRSGEDAAGPDGMAFDVDGYLYVAVYGSGRVRVVAPDGGLVDEIDVGGRYPTNLTFGGPDGRRLFMTEAEHGRVVTAEVPRPGLPLWGDPPRRVGEGETR